MLRSDGKAFVSGYGKGAEIHENIADIIVTENAIILTTKDGSILKVGVFPEDNLPPINQILLLLIQLLTLFRLVPFILGEHQIQMDLYNSGHVMISLVAMDLRRAFIQI